MAKKVEQQENNEKAHIFYRRDYRHVNARPIETIFLLFVTVVPFIYLMIEKYGDFAYWLNKKTVGLFKELFGIEPAINKVKFFPFTDPISYLEISGKTPGFTACLIIAVLSLFLILICLQIFVQNKPLMIYISISLFITMISALYFMFFKDKFPYTLGSYTYLYMSQQFVIWCMVAIITSVSLAVLPGIYGFDFLTFIVIMVYSILFGSVRYIVFVLGLNFLSNLFMAPVYFMFGIFLDFLYIVAIYAVYVRKVSDVYSQRKEQGRWSWS